jgi:hypothetical protein
VNAAIDADRCARAERGTGWARQRYPARRRADLKNARPRIRELNRISIDVGAQLRVEPDGLGSLPHSLIALLKEVEIHFHRAEGERLFAEIDARVAELLNAAVNSLRCTG